MIPNGFPRCIALLATPLLATYGQASAPTAEPATSLAPAPGDAASASSGAVTENPHSGWLAKAAAAYDEMRLDDARAALDRAARDPS
ncbi:MAG: hypothetical protein JXR83_08620, partial [Deltaproteobacteria bacterium]|nr:hypothetical protein [Deltaproteobacteria bacterium]